MNILGIVKVMWADIVQVSVASPFPGTEFYDWCKENGYLLTEDPDGCLDYKGHQKAIVSYPWLTAEEITSMVNEILKECYMSRNYFLLAARQVLRRQGLDEMRGLWY